jgi:hypothetical protein
MDNVTQGISIGIVLGSLVIGAIIELNRWHARYMKSLSPKERAELDEEIKTDLQFW